VPRTVHIPAAGGRSLHGRLFGPAEQRPGVLFVHGLHSTQAGYAERAEALAEAIGAVCLTFDLGGHGESEGSQPSLSLADHIGDVVVAYDRLVAERDVDPGRIGVAGASYGGYLAAVLTVASPNHRGIANDLTPVFAINYRRSHPGQPHRGVADVPVQRRERRGE